MLISGSLPTMSSQTFENRNRTKSPDKSFVLTENNSVANGITAANTVTNFNDKESIKIVYQTDARRDECNLENFNSLETRNGYRGLHLNYTKLLPREMRDTVSSKGVSDCAFQTTNASSIAGLSTQRSKLLASMSTHNLLQNYQKRQKLQSLQHQ